MKNKVLTWLMMLLLVGSTVLPTTSVLAEEMQQPKVENQVKEAVEQEEIDDQSNSNSTAVPDSSFFDPLNQKIELEQSAKANDSPLLLNESTLVNNEINFGGFTLEGDIIEFSYVGNPMLRSTGNSSGKLSKDYGGYTTSTAYVTINGEPAWCIEPAKPFPINAQYAMQVYHDIGIYNILYYAKQWGWDQPNSNYVDVYVALNSYLGAPHFTDSAKTSDPNVAALLNKAKVQDAPRGKFDLTNKKQTATYNKELKRQETDWSVPQTDGTNINYTINVPNGVTALTSDGKTLGAGKHTLSQNVSYKLTADARYTNIVKFDVNTNLYPQTALKFIPHDPTYQTLTKAGMYEDPIKVTGVEYTFFARTGDFELQKVAEETETPLAGIKFEITIDGKTEVRETDESGKIEIKDLLDGTEVHWKELEAPEGYYDYQEATTTVVAGETTTARVVNKIQKGRIKGIKLKEVFKPSETFEKGEPVYEIIPAEGIKFDNEVASETITRPNGSVVEDWKTGTVVDTLTTNEQGEFASNVDLYIGKQNEYQLKELEVPDNYRQPEELKAPYSIDYDSPEYDVITYDLGEVNNMLKTAKVKMNKVNELTGLPIAGAEFYVEGISENTKDVQFKFVSAITPVEHKLKEGFYRYTEIKYPDGFGQTTGESETKIIEVKDGQDITLTWKNSPETKVGKGTIRTQAHTGDGKTNIFTHGDIINAYDDIDIENDTLIGKTGKGQFEAILVAALPDGSRQEIWKSGIMDYVIEDGKFATQVVKKEVDTSKYPEGTFFYFKENVTPEGEKEPTIHNPDGKIYEQGLYPKKVTKTTPKGTLPQTGETNSMQAVTIVGMLVVIVSVAWYGRKKYNQVTSNKE